MSLLLKIALPLAGWILGWTSRWLYARYQFFSSLAHSKRLRQTASGEAEEEKRRILSEAKNQVLEGRRQFERELTEKRRELQDFERRIRQKEDNLEEKAVAVSRKLLDAEDREEEVKEREKSVVRLEEQKGRILEDISGLTAVEAKATLVASLEEEARREARVKVKKIEDEANVTAQKKARSVLVAAMQRMATEVSSEITVTTEALPNDEMKGRIIGREGRNIRTLETLTGVDIIVDDTPEAVVISSFDPIRRVIAKEVLRRLIEDGRIHPSRIEEIVQKVAKDIGKTVYEEGEKVLFELGIHNMAPEGVRALGRLYFRTSYGQNQLAHAKEVAILAGMIAAEMGADREIAKRGGLLHDIGKGLEATDSDNHIEVGVKFCRRIEEDPRVISAVASHHGDEEPICQEAVIVQIADTISAARPGARREFLEEYIKRLERLEKIALEFKGVEKVFAVQAGRELRIMVNSDQIDDQKTSILAKDIAKRIETELRYPGRIRITIIRETRVTEYAC